MSGSRTATRGTKRKRAMKKKAERQRAKTSPIKRRATSTVQLHALPGRLVLVALRGALGHPARALTQFDDMKLVGAIEDAGDLRDVILQTGAAVLAAVVNYPIGQEGSTLRGLIEAVAKFAGLDVEAIKAEIAKEAEAEARAEHEANLKALEAEEDKHAPPGIGSVAEATEDERARLEAVDLDEAEAAAWDMEIGR